MPCVNEVPLQGLELLLRAIGDEETTVHPVLHLPSAFGTGKHVEDVAKAGPILFMIPGVEGMGSILEPLARNLKYQTLCLQLGYSNAGDTAQDMAQALLPVQQIWFSVPLLFKLAYLWLQLIFVHLIKEQHVTNILHHLQMANHWILISFPGQCHIFTQYVVNSLLI